MRRRSGQNMPADACLFPPHEAHDIEVKDVTQVFLGSDGKEVWALDSLSFSIDVPEIVGFIGPSGCGKSTLLRIVAGLDEPAAGTVEFDGEVIEGANWDRTLVFQDANLFDWLTVYDNIAFGLRARGTYDQDAWKVSELIKLVGLDGFEESYPSQISGGMAGRCALARAFVQNPSLVLLDEPLSALDAFTRSFLQGEIISMQRQAQCIVLLVTHDIEEAVFMCDRIIVMSSRPGRRIAEMRVDLEHPRDRVSDRFVARRRELLSLLDLSFGRYGHENSKVTGQSPVDIEERELQSETQEV